MGERKRKEIQEYKVNEETRTVYVYLRTLSEQAEKRVDYFAKNGYKIVLLDRNKPNTRDKQRIGKKEMIKYLKDNDAVDKDIYNEMVEKFKRKEKFFEVRSWLKEQLENKARESKGKIKYVPVNTIIQVAIEKENAEIEKNKQEYKKANGIIEE